MAPTNKYPSPASLKDCNWTRLFNECLIENENSPSTKTNEAQDSNTKQVARQKSHNCGTPSSTPAENHGSSSSLQGGSKRCGTCKGMERFRSNVKHVIYDLMSKKVPPPNQLKMSHDDKFDDSKLKEWVVQWGAFLSEESFFNWREIFAHHDAFFSRDRTMMAKRHKSKHRNDQSTSRTENAVKTTLLKEFLEVLLECIWNAHLCRLNSFEESWKACYGHDKLQLSKQKSGGSGYTHHLEKIHRLQLQSLQNTFLNLWIDFRRENSSCSKSDFVNIGSGTRGARGVAGQTKPFHSCKFSPSDKFMVTFMNKMTCLFSTPVESLTTQSPALLLPTIFLDLRENEQTEPHAIVTWTNAMNENSKSICLGFWLMFRKGGNAKTTCLSSNAKTNLKGTDEEVISSLVRRARSFMEWTVGLLRELALLRCQQESKVMTNRKNRCNDSDRSGDLGPSGNNQQCVVSRALTDSMVAILSALDDADVKELRVIRRRAKKRKTTTVGSSVVSSNNKRRRLPASLNAAGVIAAMHGELVIDCEESAENEMNPSLALGNNDRYQRARRLLNAPSSNIKVSMKEMLSAPEPQPKKRGSDDKSIDYCGEHLDDGRATIISTLTLEAAVLRRDLYKYLSEIDTLDITLLRDILSSHPNVGRVIDISSISQSKMKSMVLSLLKRLTSYPFSPSVRLSTVLAIDHLRELRLSDSGYREILDALLELFRKSYSDTCDYDLDLGLPRQDSHISKPFCPLKFYADMVSECDAFSSSSRLLPALCKLMEESLCIKKHMITIDSESAPLSKVSSILQAISHIMVRRQSILSGVNGCDAKYDSKESTKIERYRRLKHDISLSFELSSYWLPPTMPKDVQERVIRILQSEDILSLFCDYDQGDSEDATEHGEANFQYVPMEYPDQCDSTLRSAHDRMGPCVGFNRLLSHESLYNLETNKLKQQITPSSPNETSQEETDDDSKFPFSSANFDVIVSVVEFLGYRSLARASQCCKSWRQVSEYNRLWANIYFSKFPNAKFDLEVSTTKFRDCMSGNFGEDNKCKTIKFQNNSQRLNYANSLEGYDWKIIFKNKYCVEKRLRKKRFLFSKSSDADGSKSKPKSCDIIGCTVVPHSVKQADDHRRVHAKNLISLEKKRMECETLEKKVSELRLAAKALGVGAVSIPNVLPRPQRNAAKITSPETLLKQLIFPFLDFGDLQSLSVTCKIWKQLGDSDSLWQHLYAHHFGEPCVKWLDQSDIPSVMNGDNLHVTWKNYFRKAHACRRSIREPCNGFGWAARLCPSLGCGSVLKNKLDYDKHMLKHEEKYLVRRIKENRGRRNNMKRK